MWGQKVVSLDNQEADQARDRVGFHTDDEGLRDGGTYWTKL